MAPDITHRFANYETVRAMVARSDAFTLLNLRPLHDTTYGGHDITCIPLSDDVPTLDIVLATAPNTQPSVRARVLAEVCRDVISARSFSADAPRRV